MRIIVFGTTGDVGSRITEEALARGHQVTGVSRKLPEVGDRPENFDHLPLDVTEPEKLADVVSGYDLIISAMRPPKKHEKMLVALTQSIMAAAAGSGTRALIIGGAANLLLPDGSGHTVLTAPDFLPDAIRPMAQACFDQYLLCTTYTNVDWSYFSPPAMLVQGKRTGKYRKGSDVLLVDNAGDSHISYHDFAVAIMDEAECSGFTGKRMTAANLSA